MNRGTSWDALTPRQLQAFRHMWANCLLNSERTDEAITLFHENSTEDDLRACEGLLDAYTLKLARMRRGGLRRHLLRTVIESTRWSLARVLRARKKEHYFDRFIWKVACFFQREEPRQLPFFFGMLDHAAYKFGPEYGARIDEIRGSA